MGREDESGLCRKYCPALFWPGPSLLHLPSCSRESDSLSGVGSQGTHRGYWGCLPGRVRLAPLEPRQLLPGEGLVGGDNFPRVLRMGVVATTVPAWLGRKEPGCRDAHVPERGQWAFPRTEEAANGMN